MSTMAVVKKPHWAASRQNRSLELYASSTTVANPVLIIGGVHGDEPEGVTLANAALKWLMAEAETHNSSVAVPWMVIPCLNPDGYFHNTRVNGAGVDLNRNYPSRDWSPEAKAERYYPGPSPASEPEIQAVTNLILQVKPRLVIHCHSWHPMVVYTGELGRSAAEALAESSGYELKPDIGYPTPGSLSRWGWHDNNIPIICIEEAEKTEAEKIWPNFANGFRRIFTDPSIWRART